MGLTHYDGMSVYGSGLYWGKKGVETPMFGAGVRCDAGTVGFSGLVQSVSTRLSTIVGAIVTPRLTASAGGRSGLATFVATDWSGGALDFTAVYSNQSSNTSGGACSGVYSWFAWGT